MGAGWATGLAEAAPTEHAPGFDDVPASPALPPLDPNRVNLADADRERLHSFLRMALATASSQPDRPAIVALRQSWVATLECDDPLIADRYWRDHVDHLIGEGKA